MKKLLPVITLLLSFFLYPPVVRADVGPKAVTQIKVNYEGQPIPDQTFYAKMLDCSPATSDEYELFYQGANDEKVIPELRIKEFDSSRQCFWTPTPITLGGECSASKCTFGYFQPSYFRLAVFVPSLHRTFLTPPIDRENMDSFYEVKLSSSGSASIEETTSLFSTAYFRLFILVFIITLVLELGASYIFLRVVKKPLRLLRVVILANLITLSVFWLVLPKLMQMTTIQQFVSIEAFIIVVETLIFKIFSKKLLTWKQACILSTVNNLISVVLGTAILFLIAYYLAALIRL